MSAIDKPRRAIAIMAKAPLPGQVKTRLIPFMNESDAAALAAAFTADIVSRLVALAPALDATLFLYYTPDDAARELRALIGEVTLRPQGTGDLGHRMRTVASALRAEGFTRTILVGADTPTLPDVCFGAAFDALDGGAQVAIARANDGGYVLLAVDEPHAVLFEEIPWSTDMVYSLSVMLARKAGLTVQEMAGWYDVDNADDLARLRLELNQGASDLAPRTSRLLAELNC